MKLEDFAIITLPNELKALAVRVEDRTNLFTNEGFRCNKCKNNCQAIYRENLMPEMQLLSDCCSAGVLFNDEYIEIPHKTKYKV